MDELDGMDNMDEMDRAEKMRRRDQMRGNCKEGVNDLRRAKRVAARASP